MKKIITITIAVLFGTSPWCHAGQHPEISGNNRQNTSLLYVDNDIRSTFSHTANFRHPAETTNTSFSKSTTHYAGFAVSATLIGYGVAAQYAPALQKLNAQTDYITREKFPRRFHLDDWLQYAPTIAFLTLDIAGVPSRHTFLQRTASAASAFIIMAAIVNIMKWSIPVLRPDGSAYNSFPSGHTATAFTGAHLLGKEYGKSYLWAGVAGYLTATATGLCRMANKRHWLSDVAAGAGIGILSVELAYLMMPLFDRWFGRHQKYSDNGTTLSITPSLTANCYGASISYVF